MPQALAIANNDLVYLWWTYESKIPDCLGFAIYRLGPGGERETVRAFAGFDDAHATATHEWKGTDYWPIQSYQWKDLFVPEETDVSYEVVPVKGTPGQQLEEIPGLAVQTGTTRATDTIGHHRVVFNRGIISTQSVASQLPKDSTGRPSAKVLMDRIKETSDPIRKSLAGEAPEALMTLLKRTQTDGGKCFCALYELTDTELIDAIKATVPNIEVILSNADGDPYDSTNHDTRVALHPALGDAIHDRLLPKGDFIGHNKFVVYVDPGGTAKAVLTGSTNWTATGLCSQSNNVLLLEDEAIAARYLDYWNRLLDDTRAGSKQDAPLRTEDAVAPQDMDLGDPLEGAARIWFSPNTPQKHKPAHDPPAPPDMNEVFDLIGNADHGVLFLLFSAGAPSILQRITEVEQARRDAGREFFVRGAISDARASNEFATRVYNDSSLEGPNVLITGIGGVDDPFAYWEEELAQLGHAVIHDKVVVIDPFSDRPVVVNGSHNLGYKASYSNDENMCIARGNARLAESFTAHVLDVVNHYNWRYKRHPQGLKEGPQAAQQQWRGLDKTDGWQDKYFRGSFLASRDRFFFPPGGG
jgi:phosphatidylserine/phosphatidylglycerophosphate/cardiolipin synthase-like enzyme